MPSLVAALDAGTILEQRSPGARGRVGLTKSKPRLDVRPIARVLPRIRAPRPAAPAPLPPPPEAVPAVADAAPLAPYSDVFAPAPVLFSGGGPGGFAAAGPGFFGFVPSFGGGGFFIGGGGGGGGGGGIIGPPPPPVDVVPPPAPIPEPATWGMMLLGFAAIGALLRRRVVRGAHV